MSTTRTRSAIWNEERRCRSGDVPSEIAPELRAMSRRSRSGESTAACACWSSPPDAWVGAAQLAFRAVAYEFKLPDLGEGLTEGEVARWLVVEGQEIAEDDPLVEIQTDKTTVEIPSPAAGNVARILVAEGDVVPVGTVLVVIGENGLAPLGAEPPQACGASRRDRAAATVAARRPPRSCPDRPGVGVDLASLAGSGRGDHRGRRPRRRDGASPGQAAASRSVACAGGSSST